MRLLLHSIPCEAEKPTRMMRLLLVMELCNYLVMHRLPASEDVVTCVPMYLRTSTILHHSGNCYSGVCTYCSTKDGSTTTTYHQDRQNRVMVFAKHKQPRAFGCLDVIWSFP